MIKTVLNYFGHSIYPVVLIALIAYLIYLVQKKKSVVNQSVLIGTVLLLLFFPVLYFVCEKIGQGAEAYRFFWLIPLNFVFAYLLVELWKHENFNKESGFILLMLTAALCGNVLGEHSILNKPDNLYEIPKEVVSVCDVINEDCNGEDVRILGESDFMICMRQYSSNLCWVYTGRGQMMQAESEELDETFFEDPQYRVAMAIGQNLYINEDELSNDIEMLETKYVVVSEDNDIINHLPDEKFELLEKTDAYNIYKLK